MKIYNYSPDTGAFIGESEADESPLEPGVVIIPAYATAIEPPATHAGKYPAFDGVTWHILDEAGPLPEVIEETPQQTIARYEAALDDWLDAKARMFRYDNRFTFALRASYPNAWRDEATAFGIWMDECNAQAYALLEAVQAGAAQMPGIDAFIDSLPVFPPADPPILEVPPDPEDTAPEVIQG